MAGDEEGEKPSGTARKEQTKPHEPTEPAGRATTPVKEEPCCCDHVTLYLDRVKVIARTDAPIPILGVLLGEAVEDRVSIICTGCDGSTFTWPKDSPGLKVKKGWDGVTPNAPLATIVPDKGCHVSCHLRVKILRASLASEILHAINKLLPDIAVAAAELAAAKLAGAAAAAVKDLQAKAEKLSQDLTELLRKLSQANESLMDECFFNFEGSLACGKNLEDAIENTSGSVAAGKSQDRIRFERVVQNYGGEWELQFSAVRACTK